MHNPQNLDLREASHVARLKSLFDEDYRLCRPLIGRALSEFGHDWLSDFEETLSLMCPDDSSLKAAAQGYSRFAIDCMRRQKQFEVEREYPRRAPEEIAGSVYFDAEHMTRQYLPGLLLSHYLWPHHYRQLLFFETAFAAEMRNSPNQLFIEVGVGTGLYSRKLLQLLPRSRGDGYDISPSSCQFAQRHIASIGAHSRFDLHERNINAYPIRPVPWLVCVEVLEHLERPIDFLRDLRAALTTDGKAFITAAVNAAHADHSYLYRSADEVRAQLNEVGFAIEHSLVAAAQASSEMVRDLPLVAAFIVH